MIAFQGLKDCIYRFVCDEVERKNLELRDIVKKLQFERIFPSVSF